MTPQEEDQNYDSNDEAIQAKINGLENMHGLSPEQTDRIRRIMEQSDAGWLDHIGDALFQLPAEETLTLFEQDLEELKSRIQITAYLSNEHVPFYSIEDLGNLIGLLLEHQEENKDSLIQTGYPQTGFIQSPWLDSGLAFLYATKMPVVPPEMTISDSEIVYTYGEWSADGTIPIEGFDPDDITHIEEGRSKIYDIKKEILKTLLHVLKKRDESSLWEDCLNIFTGGLLKEDIVFWLKMDRIYLEEEIRFLSGGITDILWLIGYCEKELTIGTMDRTRATIEGDSDLNSLNPFEAQNYFSCVRRWGQGILDSTLDCFISLQQDEQEFANEYTERVNQALEDKFDVLIPIESRFESHLRTFADLLKVTKETGIPIFELSKMLSVPSQSPPKTATSSPFPPDLLWEKVMIRLISDDMIGISTKDIKQRKYHFAKIGFDDERKGNEPDSRWELLKILIKEGELSWANAEKPDLVKKGIQDIRTRLRDATGIEDDPFKAYRAKKTYEPKFWSIDERSRRTDESLKIYSVDENAEDGDYDFDSEIMEMWTEDEDRDIEGKKRWQDSSTRDEEEESG